MKSAHSNVPDALVRFSKRDGQEKKRKKMQSLFGTGGQTLYDDLVNDLRENHDKYFARDMQAADAIEELMRYVQQMEKLRQEGWYLQKTKMMTYGQATMTMPLPQPPKEE
jgi:hypothetical protein